MTEIVTVEYFNDVHMKVLTEYGIRQELAQYFSFRPTGYQFSPKYKNRMWDGYIRLYQPLRPILYCGLLEHLRIFCKERGYELEVAKELQPSNDVSDTYGMELAEEIGCTLIPRDYQNEYVVQALRGKRMLGLSPTSSGKSLMQYLLVQHYLRAFEYRTLIIVPTVSLVHQMAGDFVDYGCDPDIIYKIQAGVEKITNAKIVISTWQSLQKLPKNWFSQFKVVIGDEAHLFTAKSLIGIMEKMTECPNKFGFTGTIGSDSKTHSLVLQGVFGPIKKYVSTKDLIDSGTVAEFDIRALVLNYPDEIKTAFKKQIGKTSKEKRYHAEREFITSNEKRNIFIRNLAWSLKNQNVLILFELVEKHGKLLEPLLKCDDKKLHFIYGDTPGIERERIRHLVEDDPVKNHIILASFGSFSTGINLKRLDAVIFASGSKSEIRVLQSIGRVLRKGGGSDEATLYDIADNLGYGSYENYTLQHFKKRMEFYSQEQFPFKVYNIDFKCDIETEMQS